MPLTSLQPTPVWHVLVYTLTSIARAFTFNMCFFYSECGCVSSILMVAFIGIFTPFTLNC